MSQTPAAPQLTGAMFLFSRPELLNKTQHGELGLDQPDRPFDFCANVRAIPLTVSEIPSAMKHYPVIFMSKEDPTPLAVVGLIDDVNLFVDDNGQWEDGTYIPGYIRRYPFALASETGGERHAIVIDGAHPGISRSGELRFFTETGESSPATQQAIEFCKQYERDRVLTGQVLKEISRHDLIQPQTAQYTPQGGGEARPFAQYFGVDEKRLADLTDTAYLELRRSNIIAVVYAQLMSLGNWRPLMQRRAKRFGLTEENVLRPAKVN